MNEGVLYNLLELRFPKEEFALIPGVRNGTGFSKSVTREADAIAVSLWPSRGIEVYGFEIKVSRGDWLREKKNPAKAEEIGQFCDRWYLVVSDPEIAPPEEVPPAWGILAAKGDRLRVVRVAQQLKAKPMDKFFVAAILRRAAKYVVPQTQIDDAIRRQIEREVESRASSDRYKIGDLERSLTEMRERIRLFQDASGVDIGHRWDAGAIGEAVKALRDKATVNDRITQEKIEYDRLMRLADESLKTIEQFRHIVASLEKQDIPSL